MKVVDTILRRTLLLSYRVVFDSFNRLSVTVRQIGPGILTEEYGRLWAAYHMKVLETLVYPIGVDALLASAIIERITAKPFTSNADCFERADLSGVVEYTEDLLDGFPDMSGRHYAKGQRRFLMTDLPADVTAKHLIHGSAGLLQYGLNRCRQNENERTFLYEMAKSVLSLLSQDSGYDTGNLDLLPDAAYTMAKRRCGRNEEGVV